jgi:hypothetical protein
MIRTGIPIDKIINDLLLNRFFSDTEIIVVAVSIVELLLEDVEVEVIEVVCVILVEFFTR